MASAPGRRIQHHTGTGAWGSAPCGGAPSAYLGTLMPENGAVSDRTRPRIYTIQRMLSHAPLKASSLQPGPSLGSSQLRRSASRFCYGLCLMLSSNGWSIRRWFRRVPANKVPTAVLGPKHSSSNVIGIGHPALLSLAKLREKHVGSYREILHLSSLPKFLNQAFAWVYTPLHSSRMTAHRQAHSTC